MGVIVGVDGGGTKTRCAVSDGARILGRSTSGGCNIVRLGEEMARSSIHSAIREAFLSAGLETGVAEAACIGVAGSAVPRVRQEIVSIVGEVLHCPISVVGDQEIAFEAAFADLPGILVIGGTGSIAFGRSADGRTARAGGHGFIISDEGSGQWIGRNAVAGCLRAADAGKDSSLMSMILQVFNASTTGELIQIANAVPLPNFSKLLPFVLQASQDGDLVATEILMRAGMELASLAKLVAGRLGMEQQEFRVAMSGGVFEHCALVREEFARSLHSSHPQATVITQVTEPLLGALSLAAKKRALARQPQ